MNREFHVRICERLGVKFPGPTRQNGDGGRSTGTSPVPQTVCPSLEEATHPRCCGEGYPDWAGRASSKEGESWVIITARSRRNRNHGSGDAQARLQACDEIPSTKFCYEAGPTG